MEHETYRLASTHGKPGVLGVNVAAAVARAKREPSSRSHASEEVIDDLNGLHPVVDVCGHPARRHKVPASSIEDTPRIPVCMAE